MTLDLAGSAVVATTTGIVFLDRFTGLTKFVLDPSDGNMTYTAVLPGPSDRMYVEGAAGGTAYVGAINLATDQFVWEHPITSAGVPSGGIATDFQDNVYVAANQLTAFSGASGLKLWAAKSPLPSGSFGSTPVIGHGGVVYATSLSTATAKPTENLAAFSTSGGTMLWSKSTTWGGIGPPVLGWQGQIYWQIANFVGSPANPLPLNYYGLNTCAVLANGDLISVGDTSGPYFERVPTIQCTDPDQTTVRWTQIFSNADGPDAFAVAVGHDGSIYYGAEGGLYQLKP